MTDEERNRIENLAISNINDGYFRDSISNLLSLDGLTKSDIAKVQSYIDKLVINK